MLLGGPSATVCLSAKFCVLVLKASLLCYLGGPLAKVSSSAKFGVAVFKVSILNFGGSICHIMYICQVMCTGSQGISSPLPRGSIGISCLSANWYSRHLSSITQGVHLPKYLHLQCFMYW